VKVLICAPSPEEKAGVANYYKIIIPYLRHTAERYTVGSRIGDSKGLGRYVRVLIDTLMFVFQLWKEEYDIIHLNPSLDFRAVVRDGLLAVIAKLFGRKVIIFFRGWQKSFEARIEGRAGKLFRNVYFRADAMIVLASEFKVILENLGYTKKIYVETTVVDDTLVDGMTEETVVSRCGRDIRTFTVLFLSRVEKYKGIYEAIEAYRILSEKHSMTRMIVAGEGCELAAVKQYVEQRGVRGVEFRGQVTGDEKRQIFCEGDVFILPTYSEGMPNAVAEAMAFGIPVVTRPVGGLKDFFEDGTMGFLIQGLKPEEFAESLERLLVDSALRSAIAYKNFSYARQRFLASKVARRIEGIYDDVVSNLE
jgi:glycosyltransferase involved in cell wall biosynthesis